MRPPLAFGLLLLAWGATGAASAEPEPPRTATRADLDRAIDAGVRWVLQEQRPDGAFGGSGEDALGETALAALALQHAGLREDGPEPEDRRLARTLAWLDRTGPGRVGVRERDPGTYATALLLLTLEARGREQDRERLERLLGLLARTQARNGQWGYQGEPGDTGRTGPETGDNSNTQLALLAVGAAAGLGLTVPPDTLARARAWWLGSRAEHGGYGYASGGAAASQPSGSMTAAAVACLAVLEAARGPQPALDRELVSARESALRWLTLNYSVTRNEGPAQGAQGQRQKNAGRGWLHYYLWTLERAFVLAGRERVAGHDWFAEGSSALVASQRPDGSWVAEAPLYATCFALLFLTRAAPPPRAFTPPPRPVGPLTPPSASPAPAPTAPAPLGPADPRATPALPPDELTRRALAEGPASLLRLARALDDREAAVRQRALEALTTLLGAERVEGAERHPLARGRLLLWLRQQQRWLVARDGRFEPAG